MCIRDRVSGVRTTCGGRSDLCVMGLSLIHICGLLRRFLSSGRFQRDGLPHGRAHRPQEGMRPPTTSSTNSYSVPSSSGSTRKMCIRDRLADLRAHARRRLAARCRGGGTAHVPIRVGAPHRAGLHFGDARHAPHAPDVRHLFHACLLYTSSARCSTAPQAMRIT